MGGIGGQIGDVTAYAAADDFDAAFPEPPRKELQAAEIPV
jgi:hypothetical protein